MNRNMRLVVVIPVLAMLVAFAACMGMNKGQEDPKKRLTEYISKSFSITKAADRSQLQSYLTGQAKTRLSAWSDEQFQQAFIDSKRQFIKLLIRETKNVSPKEVSITYELTYLDQSRGKDAKVTNKKLCQMILEQNKWYISEVTNIKELVEYRNEMSLP